MSEARAGSDVEAIVQLLNLYGLAMDTQRWELFDRVFTADAEADFGGEAHWRDLATFKRDFAAFHAPFDSTRHVMSGHLVDVRGDAARSFCNGDWRLVRRAAPGSPLWDGTGWYDDELVRTPGGWRIRRRVCRVGWWTGNPLVNETIPGVRFAMTSTSLKDEAAAGRVGFVEALAPAR